MTAPARTVRRAPSLDLSRILRDWLPWVVSLGIIAFVVASHDVGAVIDAAGRADLLPFLLITGIWAAVNLLFEGWFCHWSFVWACGVRQLGAVLRVRAAAYILTMLSSVLGYGGIVVYAKRRFGVSYGRGAMIMANEALHEVGSMGLLALGVALWLTDTGQVPQMAAAQLDGVTIFGAGCVGLYLAAILASRVFPAPDPTAPLSLFHDFELRHYAGFMSIKLVQNVIHGIWIVLALPCFGVSPPAIVSIAFTQVIHLVHGLPVSAFGIGVDQLMVPALFAPWAPDDGGGSLLAFSVAYTFAMVVGRASIGLLVVRGVVTEIQSPSPDGIEEAG
jgi:hypothetical protein